MLTAVSNGTVTVTATSLELNSDVSDQLDIAISGQPTTEIESIAGAENILIYPNPANGGFFTIKGMQNISSVTVLDINGKQIITRNVSNQSSTEVHLDVPAGLYIIRLSDGTRFYYVKIAVK